MLFSQPSSIHIQISDGLGNQMFQYAAGLSLALKNKVPLVLEPVPYFFKIYKPPRRYGLQYLNLHPCIQLNRPIRKTLGKVFVSNLRAVPTFVEKNAYQFEKEFLTISPPFRLQGFFQNVKYFSELPRDMLLENFRLNSKMSSKAIGLCKAVKEMPNAACIHLRLGDYKTSSIFKPLSLDYYREGLKVLRSLGVSHDSLWLFSNGSMAEIKSFCHDLKLINPRIVSGNEVSEWEAMHLMKQFKHHLIANSTFSWWSAWLKETPGLTIMPKNWLREPSWEVLGLKVPGWIEL